MNPARWLKSHKVHFICAALILFPIFVAGSLFALSSTINLSSDDTSNDPKSDASQQAPAEAISADRIFDLVNEERQKAGVTPLTKNDLAIQAAQAKCADMVNENYYDHVNPDTGKHGYVYTQELVKNGEWYNENINKGDVKTNQEFVTSWINSPDHKVTMLDGKFTDSGVAVCHNSKDAESEMMIVQEFVSIPKTNKLQASATTNISVKPSGCTRTTLLKQTKYQDASWLEKGQTEKSTGQDGYIQYCPYTGSITVPAIDDTIYRGTYVAPKPLALRDYGPTETPEQRNAAIAACIQKMQVVAPNGSAYIQCYNL